MKKLLWIYFVFSLGLPNAHAFFAHCKHLYDESANSERLTPIYRGHGYRDWVLGYECKMLGKDENLSKISFRLELLSDHEVGLDVKSLKLNRFSISCPTLSKKKFIAHDSYDYIKFTFFKAEAGAVVSVGAGVGSDDRGNPCLLLNAGLIHIGARTGVIQFRVGQVIKTGPYENGDLIIPYR